MLFFFVCLFICLMLEISIWCWTLYMLGKCSMSSFDSMSSKKPCNFGKYSSFPYKLVWIIWRSQPCPIIMCFFVISERYITYLYLYFLFSLCQNALFIGAITNSVHFKYLMTTAATIGNWQYIIVEWISIRVYLFRESDTNTNIYSHFHFLRKDMIFLFEKIRHLSKLKQKM